MSEPPPHKLSIGAADFPPLPLLDGPTGDGSPFGSDDANNSMEAVVNPYPPAQVPMEPDSRPPASHRWDEIDSQSMDRGTAALRAINNRRQAASPREAWAW
jgi:hypothetical protein